MQVLALPCPVIDRHLFVPIRLPAVLGAGGYIELTTAERSRESHWRVDGGLCVRDAAFDFVGGCFEHASAGFDLLSNTRFSVADTGTVSEALGRFAEAIENDAEGREVVFSRYASMMNPAVWSATATASLKPGVLLLARALQRFTWAAAASRRPLWVLGV